MSEFRADLHCHSTCSDGSLTPKELILLAKENGLSGLSITDHDSVAAYPEAQKFAKEVGLALIPGVEFSAEHKTHSVHILGYSFDPSNSSLLALCQRHEQRRKNRNQAILARLAKSNMQIDEEEVIAIAKGDFPDTPHTIGRPHIALAMTKKGYVASPQDAFKLFIGDGKSCFVQGEQISVEETIDVLHQANGFAVIAHPHLLKNVSIEALLEFPFDGIECYYAQFAAWQNERWLKIAQEKSKLITGGSDFHGLLKPSIPLGSSWVDETRFKALIK